MSLYIAVEGAHCPMPQQFSLGHWYLIQRLCLLRLLIINDPGWVVLFGVEVQGTWGGASLQKQERTGLADIRGQRDSRGLSDV